MHRAECLPLRILKSKSYSFAENRDKTNTTDCITTSLLSVLSKLLESRIHKHLVTYLETRDLSAIWRHENLSIHFSRASTVNTRRVQELCESRGGRPGLPSLISLQFLWTTLQQQLNQQACERAQELCE